MNKKKNGHCKLMKRCIHLRNGRLFWPWAHTGPAASLVRTWASSQPSEPPLQTGIAQRTATALVWPSYLEYCKIKKQTKHVRFHRFILQSWKATCACVYINTGPNRWSYSEKWWPPGVSRGRGKAFPVRGCRGSEEGSTSWMPSSWEGWGLRTNIRHVILSTRNLISNKLCPSNFVLVLN